MIYKSEERRRKRGRKEGGILSPGDRNTAIWMVAIQALLPISSINCPKVQTGNVYFLSILSRGLFHRLLKIKHIKNSPKIGRAIKSGGTIWNRWKFNIFVFFKELRDLRKAVISQKYFTGGILICQGQFGKATPEAWETWHFLSLVHVFLPSLP